MSLDPEVIPPSQTAGKNAISVVPKWIIIGVIGVGLLIFIGILKTLFPLIMMGLIVGFIIKQASIS